MNVTPFFEKAMSTSDSFHSYAHESSLIPHAASDVTSPESEMPLLFRFRSRQMARPVNSPSANLPS